jgi:hypothetical protein
VKYGLGVLGVTATYRLTKLRLMNPKFLRDDGRRLETAGAGVGTTGVTTTSHQA